MSTLAVVEEILRETGVPMSVREIVERAGVRLPSKSKTPDTVVARDLAMDLKKKADSSLFARTSPGRYTLRGLVPASASGAPTAPTAATDVAPMSATGAAMGTLSANHQAARKPAAAATSTSSSSAAGTGTRANAP